MEKIALSPKNLSLRNACVGFMFAYQQRDVSKMMEFCQPEGQVYFEPLGEAGRGKIGELGKAIWNLLIACFPDIDNTVDSAIAPLDEPDTIQCQVIIRGTQSADFADIPNRGKSFESDHIFIFHLNDEGKIDSIRVSWDHGDFRRQLGAES